MNDECEPDKPGPTCLASVVECVVVVVGRRHQRIRVAYRRRLLFANCCTAAEAA